MATKTAVKEETVATPLPKFETVKAMPKPRRGRQSMDLTPFEDLIKDEQPHAIPDVTDRNIREKWARRIRKAADNIGLEVETTYDENEGRLYFKGWKQGEAPARGRRSRDTRTNSK